MSRQTPVLIKSFPVDASNTNFNVCQVMSGSNAGNVALPSAANATKFVGVAVEPTDSNGYAAVQVSGIVQVKSDGSAVSNPGDYLVIADNTGAVKSVAPADGSIIRQVVGINVGSAQVAATAGLLIDMLIQPMIYPGV